MEHIEPVEVIVNSDFKYNAYILDPKLPREAAAKFRPTKADWETIEADYKVCGTVSDLGRIVMLIEPKYEIPSCLDDFAKAVYERDIKPNEGTRMFDGPVIVQANVQPNPDSFLITGREAGFFDLMKTSRAYQKVPHDYSPSYPEGKNLRQLAEEGWKGLSTRDMANWIGCAHVLLTEMGKSLMLVQRGNLAIAPNVMALSGDTPHFPIGWHQYAGTRTPLRLGNFLDKVYAEEMKEEFNLSLKDLAVSKHGYVAQEVSAVTSPEQYFFYVPVILTPKTAKQVAQGCYNNPEVLKEHSIIYEIPMDKEVSKHMVDRLLPSTISVIKNVLKR